MAAHSGLYLNGTVIGEAALQPYVDEFLNELEFLLGDSSTKYGAIRAKIGRSEPWRINFVEIGNEDNLKNGSSSYNSYRFSRFYTAVKAKYPNITIMASFDAPNLPDVAAKDYHTYDRPNRLINSFSKFDGYDRKHKVLLG